VITGMFHTGITVSSLERAMAFYGGVLAIERTHSQVSDQPYLSGVTGLPGASLLIGFARTAGEDLALEILQFVAPPGVQSGTRFGRVGSVRACWAVDDLAAVRGRLAAAGVPGLGAPHASEGGPWDGATSALVLDPDGVAIELLERPAGDAVSGRLTSLHHTTMVVSDVDAAAEALGAMLGLTLTARHACESGTARDLGVPDPHVDLAWLDRSEEHTSELQSPQS
jgi:catechol 2,3-dioxygenase-like lactoylglutathione lyase family enzyme